MENQKVTPVSSEVVEMTFSQFEQKSLRGKTIKVVKIVNKYSYEVPVEHSRKTRTDSFQAATYLYEGCFYGPECFVNG